MILAHLSSNVSAEQLIQFLLRHCPIILHKLTSLTFQLLRQRQITLLFAAVAPRLNCIWVIASDMQTLKKLLRMADRQKDYDGLIAQLGSVRQRSFGIQNDHVKLMMPPAVFQPLN